MSESTPSHLVKPGFYLGRYYSEVLIQQGDQLEPDAFDAAAEAAIEAIICAGFDGEDSDQLGQAMSDDVQTLLTLAFVRCPELMEVFTHTLYDPSAG